MKRVLAAIAFLTRVPVPARWQFDGADVGRATMVFPLVGLSLGGLNVAALYLFRLRGLGGDGLAFGQAWLPPTVMAVVLVLLNAWLTGAIHLDGLADMADGFGGGRTREDVLRIMRDHVIGSYGASALILLLLLKVACLSSLIERGKVGPYLLLAPVLARWAIVPLGFFLPYSRRESAGLGQAVTEHVGWPELLGATVLAAACTVLVAGGPGFVCLTGVCLMTAASARLCMRRIGGVTGDTLGANTEACEALVLVIATALSI